MYIYLNRTSHPLGITSQIPLQWLKEEDLIFGWVPWDQQHRFGSSKATHEVNKDGLPENSKY